MTKYTGNYTLAVIFQWEEKIDQENVIFTLYFLVGKVIFMFVNHFPSFQTFLLVGNNVTKESYGVFFSLKKMLLLFVTFLSMHELLSKWNLQ